MDAQLEAKLIECLDALAQGEAIERILSRYPTEAAQLRPMLETAAGLPLLRMEPSEAAKMQSRQQFMAQADRLRRAKPRRTPGFLPRLAAGIIAAMLVAGVLGTGAVAASGSALPGDPLYGLKRVVENVQLSTAGSPAQREKLQREFEQRRRAETGELLEAGREGEVNFTGTIEAIQPGAWIVSSLVVQLDARTQITGTPQIDRVAEVRGVTGPQGLRASSISIESSEEPTITPTPEPTETPQATETPKPSETPAPRTTITPQPTATRQPTTRPRPTAIAQPAATPQPAEVEFTGNVNSIEDGTWNIDGTTVNVNNDTEILGTINTGQRVKVKALSFADGRLVAVRIELSEGGAGGDSNSNDNQNSNTNHSHEDNNSNDNGNNSNDNGGNHTGNDGNSNENENSGNSNSDGGENANGNDGGGNHNGNDDHGENQNGNGD
jgi:AcrR family transcriptional regulator